VSELVRLGASVQRRTRGDDPEEPFYFVVMHDRRATSSASADDPRPGCTRTLEVAQERLSIFLAGTDTRGASSGFTATDMGYLQRIVADGAQRPWSASPGNAETMIGGLGVGCERVECPGTPGEGEVPRVGLKVQEARYQREVAALDLTDAEQAEYLSVTQTDLAAGLYFSADRHRRIAEQIETADTSAVLEAETDQPIW
jgi:hypothetical protein